jgi:hypothetical protein
LKDKIEKNDLIEREKLKGEFFFFKKKEDEKKMSNQVAQSLDLH